MRPTEKNIVATLAKLLYHFLPARGPVSKGDGIVRMLQWTVAHKPEQLPVLVEAIVMRSIADRNDGVDPLTRENIAELGRLLIQVGVPVPAFAHAGFLRTLPAKTGLAGGSPIASDILAVDDGVLRKLKRQHMVLGALSPHARGYAFEKFLSDLFEVFELASRNTFRVLGDQIEGVFRLDREAYLLAAKWQSSPVGAKDLTSFCDKVKNESGRMRGVFISNSGFCPDELDAYSKNNPVVYVDGLDIYGVLRGRLRFDDAMRAKIHQAKHTGRSFVRIRELLGLRRHSAPGIAA